MSAFKDAVERDIRAVFINLDEFGEIHNIDGKELVVALDSDRLAERRDKAGLSVENLYFYVKASELSYRPKVDSAMIFDGMQHLVTECIESGGVYEVALMRQNVGVM